MDQNIKRLKDALSLSLCILLIVPSSDSLATLSTNAGLAQISVRNSPIWATDTSNRLYRIVEDRGNVFSIADKAKVREGVKNVGAAFDGSVWVVDLTGKLYRYKDGQCWSGVDIDENWPPAKEYYNTSVGFRKDRGFPTPIQVSALSYNEALVATDIGLVMFYSNERWQYLNNLDYDQVRQFNNPVYYGSAIWVAISSDGTKYAAKNDLDGQKIAKFVCSPECRWETVLKAADSRVYTFDVLNASRTTRIMTTASPSVIDQLYGAYMKMGWTDNEWRGYQKGPYENICFSSKDEKSVFYSAAVTEEAYYYINAGRKIVREQ